MFSGIEYLNEDSAMIKAIKEQSFFGSRTKKTDQTQQANANANPSAKKQPDSKKPNSDKSSDGVEMTVLNTRTP